MTKIKKCPCCGQNTEKSTIEISDMSQDEFIKRKLEMGYINFKIFGYTIDEIKAIIDAYMKLIIKGDNLTKIIYKGDVIPQSLRQKYGKENKMLPNQPTNEPLKYGVSNMSEQHEPEITQEEKDEQEWMNASLGKPLKYIHYCIQIEPNSTIGLYKDGKSVKIIDFWILDGRGNR
jgi:hypothetical protein